MQNIVNGAIHLFSIFYFFIFISIFSIYSSVYWHSNYIQKICDSEILKAHIKLFDGYISKTHFYLIATCDTFLYLILLFKLVTTCQSAVPSMPQCAKVCQSPPSSPKCQSPPSAQSAQSAKVHQVCKVHKVHQVHKKTGQDGGIAIPCPWLYMLTHH